MAITSSTCSLSPCALCQFDIASGDDIVIGTVLYLEGLRWDPEDEAKWATLRQSIHDSNRRARDHPALGTFKCYHSGCLDMVDLEDPVRLLQFGYAMQYRQQPTLQQKNLRRHRLKACLSTELLKHFAHEGTSLPLELWNMVAEHLLPHYASASARSLWKRPPRSQPPVSMAEDIWCKYVEFEGTRYVATLSNTPSDGWELIYRPSGETIKYIFMGENHLGVMRLLFSTSSNVPQVDETPEIWWCKVRIEGEDPTLRQKFDGIKLRRFRGFKQDVIAWSIPQPGKIRFGFLTADLPQKFPGRMSSLICNGPLTVGYSILWAGRMVTIHAHRGIQDWACYQSAPRGSWLHIPMDPGEIITEIWLRRGRQPRERALGFKTNLDRVFIAGIYCDYLYGRPRWWSLVDRPGQTRMFFEASEKEITLLAFESRHPIGPNLLFPPSLPSEENPVPTDIEDYFYSDHYLAGLVQITPCRIGNNPGFAGMLLHFSNGHRESVGQVRLDCLCLPILLKDSMSWYLAFNKTNDEECTYLAAITATQCSPDSDFEKVIQLSCKGRLEWFWSDRQCYAIYNQTSQCLCKPGLPGQKD